MGAIHATPEVIMVRFLLTSLAFLPLVGCVVSIQETPTKSVDPPPAEVAPYIEWADAGCYWSSYDGDFVWWFEADVLDGNGIFDVDAVYADVLDWNGNWIDSFELFRDGSDPILWYSDWLELSTWLDCRYNDYLVEFVAYDALGAMDTVDVIPLTY